MPAFTASFFPELQIKIIFFSLDVGVDLCPCDDVYIFFSVFFTLRISHFSIGAEGVSLTARRAAHQG